MLSGRIGTCIWVVKNLPAMWKTSVGPLSQEDPLEKDMATLSSILAQRIPWTEACPATIHGAAESDTSR